MGPMSSDTAGLTQGQWQPRQPTTVERTVSAQLELTVPTHAAWVMRVRTLTSTGH